MLEIKSTRSKEFFEHFEKLAPKYSKYRKRYKYFWQNSVKYCNYYIQDENTVIEIGCGNGDSLSEMKGKEKTGIDFSSKMIELAKEKYPDIEFHTMLAEEINLDKKYDVVLLTGVMGYFDNVLDVLNSVKKICHPRTRIIISYYNHFWEPVLRLGELFGLKKRSPRKNWLSKHDIENLLYMTDFEAFRTTRSLFLPINRPIVSYIFNRYLARLPLLNSMCVNKFINARPIFHQKEDKRQEYSTTVVIPARNESGNIEDAIKRLPKFGKHVEIIYVEGNSTDDTWETIQKIQEKYKNTHDIKITQQEGKGKGDAVRKGYSIATGDILMILDADLTVPPEDIPKFYEALASGKGEFINGSRLVYPMEKEAMRSLNTVGNKFFSWVFSWLLEQPIKDTLCGTKVMFRDDYIRLQANRKFFGEFDPFGDYDLLFGAYKLNLKIIDLPIRYRERTYGDTNISRFRHGFLLLRMCWYAAGKIKFW